MEKTVASNVIYSLKAVIPHETIFVVFVQLSGLWGAGGH